jgi:hypothetical protein
MGQYDVHCGKGQEELVNRPEVFQALSGVVMANRFIDVQEKGNSQQREGPQDVGKAADIPLRELLLVEG